MLRPTGSLFRRTWVCILALLLQKDWHSGKIKPPFPICEMGRRRMVVAVREGPLAQSSPKL